MTTLRNILLLGGTGFVGRSVCAALVTRTGAGSGRLIVPSRHPQRATHLRPLPTVELVQADLHADDDLLRLVRQADAVINLVAVLNGRRQRVEQVNVQLPQRLARACATAGVRRLIHVSTLGVSVPPGAAPAPPPSQYLRTKGEGEAALRAAPGLDLTVLRPAVVFGEQDHFVTLFARLQAVLPFMPLARSTTRLQPVWVEDLARAVVHSLDHPKTIGQTLECAGPQVMTLADIVRLAGAWSNHPRPILPLPAWVGYLQGLLMELLPGEPLLSRDNIATLSVMNVAGGELPGLRLWGIEPSPMSSVMPAVLGHQQGPARLDAWRRRHRT